MIADGEKLNLPAPLKLDGHACVFYRCVCREGWQRVLVKDRGATEEVVPWVEYIREVTTADHHHACPECRSEAVDLVLPCLEDGQVRQRPILNG